MSDRNNLLLYDTYVDAFICKAYESGYMPDLKAPYYDKKLKMNQKKNKILEMLLLYDRVTLVDANQMIRYDKIIDTGIVDIVMHDDELLFWGVTEEEIDKEYLLFLKPFVINSMLKKAPNTILPDSMNPLLRLKGINMRAYYSELFDLVFDINLEVHHDMEIIRTFAFMIEDLLNSQQSNLTQKEFSRVLDIKGYGFSELANRLKILATTLIALLELSVETNGVLMQNAYDMDSIELDSGISHKREKLGEAYQIVRISYENVIGKLPKLDNFNEVLRLKEKRFHDIQRLKCVLDEIETIAKAGNIKKALEKAEKDIRLAANDLSRGTIYENVAKWSSYITLPVSAIELYFHTPPVISIPLGIVGAATTLKSEKSKSKNGWIQVIR